MSARAVSNKAENLIKDTKFNESRRESDTIRLWESYRDQALLWRALALLQIVATATCAILSIMLYYNRETIINVPPKPLPGKYSVDEIIDAEFQEVATSFVNLIASYQPAIARRQYAKAREMLGEPLLTDFDKDMMGAELRAIENTKRTQLYFVDPAKTQLIREGNAVKVSMVGDRVKFVAGKELPALITRYTITMVTIPRNDINPYGIIVTNVMNENVEN